MRHTVREGFHSAIRPYWNRLIQDKIVYLVYGMRRSGNHALINWLVNSYYGRQVTYQRTTHYLFRSFPDHKVLLINSFFQESAATIAWHVIRNRNLVRGANVILLSAEDRKVSESHFLIPKSCKKILVDRNVMNLVASRMKKQEVEARKPKGIGANFRVDDSFFRSLASLRGLENDPSTLLWNYDKWLESADYRRKFLGELGLKEDVLPEMSIEAGGSSFGDSKHAAKANSKLRFHDVVWTDDVLKRLTECGSVLTEEERCILDSILHSKEKERRSTS